MKMKRVYEFSLLTGLTLLTLALATPAAFAISPVAEAQCDAADAADDDLWAYFANYPTQTFGPSGCSNFCKGLSKVCDLNAKARAKCAKADDKFHHLLTRKLCDDDAECAAQAKADELADKGELKLVAADAKTECRALQDSCLTDCAQGMINPQS
jgi:hypothetical protein